ncbi:MAG: hypothetical protein ACRERU_16185 [Methylococcales bacterium]
MFRKICLLVLFFSLGIASLTQPLFSNVSAAQDSNTPRSPKPAIAHHPTSPVRILAVHNLDVSQKYYWRNVTIDVLNLTTEPITKVQVDLRLAVQGYTKIIDFGSDTPLLPNQTITLKCTFSSKFDETTQVEAEQSFKACFAPYFTEFKGFTWFNGQYCRSSKSTSEGPISTPDKALETQMLRQMNTPLKWKQSKEFLEYNELISNPSAAPNGPLACRWTPNGHRQRSCPQSCGGTKQSPQFIDCADRSGCYRIDVAQRDCNGCLIWEGDASYCGSYNTD